MELTYDLVDRIVELVLAHLARQEAAERRVLALFCGGTGGREEALASLQALSGEGWTLEAAFTPSGAQILHKKDFLEHFPTAEILVEDKIPPRELAKRADLVLIPVLTANSAAKLAQGMADNFALSLALAALLEGKRVLAAENACCPGGNGPLADLFAGYRTRLEGYGVEFCPAASLAEAAKKPPRREPAGRFTGKVFSLRDLSACRGGVLELPEGALVTPSAREAAAARGVCIRKAEN